MTASPTPRLQDLSVAELKAEWQLCFGRPPPPHAAQNFFIGNLRWHQQAAVQGGLSKTSKRRLRALAAAFRQNPDYRPPGTRPPLKPFAIRTTMMQETGSRFD